MKEPPSDGKITLIEPISKESTVFRFQNLQRVAQIFL